MPKLTVHCALSKKRTGQNFRELHEWIDEHHKTLGMDHRTVRHSLCEEDMECVRKRWGDKGVVEWLFHIAIDYLWTSYKISKGVYKQNAYDSFWIELEDNGYIDIDFDRIRS